MIPIKPPCSRTTREQKESSQVVLCKLGTSSMIRRLLLLLCQLALAAAASSSKVVTSLPGFQGRLPFHLETGYVEVDEDNGTELFYYFVESEARGENDPFLLWLTGGDHCSVLSGLAFEIGPFNFVVEPYNGTIPSLEINPNSWTKVAHILFVDSPAGAGFSFSRQPKGYHVGEVSTSLQLHEFLIKWIRDHPKFLSSPLYIGGDSYAGKIVPFIAQKISEGNKVGRRPLLNLKYRPIWILQPPEAPCVRVISLYHGSGPSHQHKHIPTIYPLMGPNQAQVTHVHPYKYVDIKKTSKRMVSSVSVSLPSMGMLLRLFPRVFLFYFQVVSSFYLSCALCVSSMKRVSEKLRPQQEGNSFSKRRHSKCSMWQ
ncbi:unnamed protein product [Triticum turgidum subsp. durum]|uniref:Carboxypeptidase n=1 Tax=Triticum turgidum subsp. durum TaxID=4567 RepID=A0A9R1RR90_TRITD|nr:unnamed protein product [Triticum turgidum subsp. durum]